MGELSVITEPDAAAHYVWKTLSDRLFPTEDRLVPGDSFLLLDCGGQTVDATVYEVDRLKPDRLDQRVSTRRVFCGSSSLNEMFRSALVCELEASGTAPSPESLDDAVISFEYGQKREFDMYRDDVFDVIPIRSTDGSTVDVHLEPGIIRAMFQATLGQMKELVEMQLEEAKAQGLAVETVVVVGGLSDCRSIEEYLEELFSKVQSIRKRKI